jgi:hypothetical protein
MIATINRHLRRLSMRHHHQFSNRAQFEIIPHSNNSNDNDKMTP